MTSEQYVESVKQMMNQQNIFFSIFLAILAIVLTFVGVIQWRLSSKQIELIKEQAKTETEEEIAKKLGVDEIGDYPRKIDNEIKNQKKELSKLNRELLKQKEDRLNFESYQLMLDLSRLTENNLGPLTSFSYILDTYESLLENDRNSLNLYVNSIITWIEKGFIEKKKSKEEVRQAIYRFEDIVQKIDTLNRKSKQNTNNYSIIEKLERKINRLKTQYKI